MKSTYFGIVKDLVEVSVVEERILKTSYIYSAQSFQIQWSRMKCFFFRNCGGTPYRLLLFTVKNSILSRHPVLSRYYHLYSQASLLERRLTLVTTTLKIRMWNLQWYLVSFHRLLPQSLRAI